MGGSSTALLAVAALAMSAAAVRLLMNMAPQLGLVDIPGGRKSHHAVVPLVGGLAIFISLLICGLALGFSGAEAYCLLALSLVICIGLWDDIWEISPRLK